MTAGHDLNGILQLMTSDAEAQNGSIQHATVLEVPAEASIRAHRHADRHVRLLEAERLRKEFLKRQGLGRAAQRYLEGELLVATEWAAAEWQPEKSDFAGFIQREMRRVLNSFHDTFSQNALWKELRDQEERDAAAVAGPHDCNNFLEVVDRRLRTLRHGAPNRWYIEGIDPVDLHQEVIIEVLDAIKHGTEGFIQYERVGQEATLILIYSVRSRLLKQRQTERRWRARSVERGVSACQTPEDILVEYDRKQQISTWPKRLKPLLSHPQQRWLQVLLKYAAKCDMPKWSHAAALLGRDKSSAIRAVELLQNKLDGLHAREWLR